MARVNVGIASQKGGVGKTTLALNLAFALARRGWRTLLVDTDPQGAIGLSLFGQARERKGLAECIRGEIPATEAVLGTRIPELKLLPLGQLSAVESLTWSEALQDGQRLRKVIEDLGQQVDILLFDTPSGFFGPTLGVLRAVDHLVIPLQAEPLTLRSIPQILEMVAALHDEGSDLRVAGMVLSMLQSRVEDSLAVAREAWSLFPSELILDAFVPRDPTFLRASREGVPVGLLGRRPPAVAGVFDQIAAELEPRLGLEDDEQTIHLLD